MSEREFGHAAYASAGCRIDAWGVGPYLIEIANKVYRFEDSDRFGPYTLGAKGEPLSRQPGERSPFWHAYQAWRDQGRRLAADGKSCVWDEPKPMTVRHVAGRHYAVVEQGENGGAIIIETESSP